MGAARPNRVAAPNSEALPPRQSGAAVPHLKCAETLIMASGWGLLQQRVPAPVG